jgi:hypothetical protein
MLLYIISFEGTRSMEKWMVLKTVPEMGIKKCANCVGDGARRSIPVTSRAVSFGI